MLYSQPLNDSLYPACIALPSDGRSVALGDSRSHVAVYELARAKKPAITTGPEADRYLRVFDRDGETALATDPYSLVTDLITGRGKKWVKYTGPKLHSYDAIFSADGKYIFNSGWDYLTWFEVKTHTELWRVAAYANPNFVRGSMACSPDGRYVAAGITSISADPRESVVQIRETANGRIWKTLKSPQVLVTAAAFSADSRLLVTASSAYHVLLPPKSNEQPTYVITLWEVATGMELARFAGHEGTVRALAFAPDSKTFFSASNDGTVLRWDWLGLDLKQDNAARLDEQTWSDLAGRRANRVYAALQQLSASDARCVPFLKERLQLLPVATREMMDRLKRDLDDDNFKVRDAAERELAALGEQAIGPLEETLLLRPSAEAERRIRKLLKERETDLYPPDELRRMRAVLMLERIGNADAKKSLETLAASKANVASVRQAREALERLKNSNR